MRRWIFIVVGLALTSAALVVFRVHVTADFGRLQHFVSPGSLSEAHAFLQDKCSVCHTPVRGVEAANCIVCHATNENLLQRQPTAFHANISRCAECHVEHQGASVRPVVMDHATLARIGLSELKASSAGSENRLLADRIQAWLGAQTGTSSDRLDLGLNCATCHATKDPHFGLFGNDCSECHVTEHWTVAGFRHPSSRSLDCAQCHQAPPSHYMGHFRMVSMKVAGVRHAEVSQCYLCHQTTSWNDIRSVGFYKHH